ncbi:CBS domain-containing protein [Streptomyces sp. NPDC054975]
MTLVAQPRPDAPDETDPQVWDAMTVEVALSVMAGARAGHLIVRDDDGRRTGLVTQTQLTVFRASSAYTDRVRLRDLLVGPSSSSPCEVPCAA